MRRLIVLVLAVTFVATGSFSGSAQADSLRVRTDPNDSSVVPDIRLVTTDLSTSTVLLKITTYDPLRFWNVHGEFMLYMDTFGDPGFDRWIEIYSGSWHGKRGFVCLVEDNVTLAFIGDLPASRPDRWSVTCKLPRAWFGHIDRAVRFFVQVRNIGERRTDRAPDRGLYIWI